MSGFCPNCGAKSVYDANFCPECGYPLTVETVQAGSFEIQHDTDYPLPEDVRGFLELVNGSQINFQTSLGLKQITAFYRQAFARKGLAEDAVLTTITEESISLVFNRANDENMIVLQAVELANGTNTNLRNVNLRTEKRSIKKKPLQPRKYEVFVDDNFHYMDESERYKLGEFENCEKAVAACKKIVDEFLEGGYTKGMSFKELYEGYIMFGEDPFIVSGDKACFFSAWDYAKKRCKELCGEE